MGLASIAYIGETHFTLNLGEDVHEWLAVFGSKKVEVIAQKQSVERIARRLLFARKSKRHLRRGFGQFLKRKAFQQLHQKKHRDRLPIRCRRFILQEPVWFAADFVLLCSGL